MQLARKEGIGSIPRATGGIARMACARLGEMGKDPAPVLAKAGMTTEEAGNPADPARGANPDQAAGAGGRRAEG